MTSSQPGSARPSPPSESTPAKSTGRPLSPTEQRNPASSGLDDLDIITDESGQAAVRAGRYLDENIYVTVQTDVDGGARAEVTLDLSDRVSARGSVGSDGNSTIGIFYERDY